MKNINSFLWLCAGVNKSVLKRCPTEGAKYAGIGATILFTGILASLAAGYACFTIFDNAWYSMLFGTLWGVMIFNLDRYVVSSMKKRNKLWKEIYLAIPRLILALLIAVVISKPLELKIFDKEISSELIIMEQEVFKAQEEGIGNRYNTQIKTLQSEIGELKNEISTKTTHRNQLVELARQEADGTGGTQKRNPGPIYKIKKTNADKVEEELKELVAKNQPLINERTNSISLIREKIAKEKQQLERTKYDGFAARIDALSRLKTKSSAISWAEWFIFSLFIALETAPIFVKLISNKGPYDELLEAHEHQYIMKNATMIANQTHTSKIENEHLGEAEKTFLNEKFSANLN